VTSGLFISGLLQFARAAARRAGGKVPGPDSQAGAADQDHGDGHEDESVGDRAGGDGAGDHPVAKLRAEPVVGAVGEQGTGADDRDPQQRVAPAGGAHRPAGLPASVDAHEGEGDQPDGHSGGRAGELDGQTRPVGGDPLQEQRDDGSRRQDRPQGTEPGDLAMGSEVGLQHGRQDHGVDDFGGHERGHRVTPSA
jgi:hypothetical protein